MASFTDSISQFNPYVAQLPVDTMYQVGMAKQKMYDQGVQKVQNQVDNILGLDIIKGIDKPYLQSKFNELGSRLKTVAAGDFSNSQLVNSIGGMTGAILKDPRIQNSVASTKRAKAELATATALYKEGKTSINNVNDIQKKINRYANSEDPDQIFTDKYVNFQDLNKKNIDIADNLKKTAPEDSRDNPYKTDYLGRTLYYFKDKDGNIKTSTDIKSGGVPEIDKAMKRITIKGVSAQTMYDAISSNLTDDDIAQLKINAGAHYEGKGVDAILKDYTDGVALAQGVIKDGIRKLNVALGDSKYTQVEKDEMQAQINKLNNKLTDGSFEEETAEFAKSLEDPKNIDKIHYDAYTRNYLNKQATTLSNQSYKEELLSNPYQQAYHQDAVLQQQIKKNNQDHQMDVASLQFKYADLANKKYEFGLEYGLKAKEFEKKYPGIVVEDSPVATNMEVPTLGNIDNVISKATENQTTLDNKYIKLLGKDKDYLDDIYKKYSTNQTSITNNDELKYVLGRAAFANEIVLQNNIKKKVTEGSKEFDDKIDKALEGQTGLIGSNGKQIFSAKDLFEVKNIVENYTKSRATGAGIEVGGGSFGSINIDAIRKAIGTNPQRLAIATALIKKYNNDPTTTSTEKSVYDKTLSISNKMAPVIGKIVDEKNAYQAKVIAQYDPHYQQQLGTMNTSDEYDMAMLKQLVGTTISKLESGQGLDMPSGFSQPTKDGLAKMFGSDGKLLMSPVIRKNRDGSALVELHRGSDVEVIPVSAENLPKYFKKVAITNPYNADFYAVAASPFNSTNRSQTGPGDKSADQVTAAHSGHEIPNLRGTNYASRVRWDFIGDPDNDEEEEIASKKFAIRFFVEDGKGHWIPDVTTGGYRSPSTIQDYIENQVGTKTFDQFLKTHTYK